MRNTTSFHDEYYAQLEGAFRERVTRDVKAEIETFGWHPSAEYVVDMAANGLARVHHKKKEIMRRDTDDSPSLQALPTSQANRLTGDPFSILSARRQNL